MSLPTVIYVAGYGRSGSTLLDVLLGNHPECLSLGEVGEVPSLLARGRGICSCGAALRECEHWMPIIRDLEQETGIDMAALADSTNRLERWRSLAAWQSQPADNATRHRYATGWSHLFGEVSRRAGVRYVVDSTKTTYPRAWRPLALARLARLQVKVILLFRDVEAVVQSKRKGNNKKLARGEQAQEALAGVRAVLGWVSANLFGLIARQGLPPGDLLVLRYEDLVSAPTPTLTRVGDFLGLEMIELVSRIHANDAFEAGHLVEGNRMAREGLVRLRGLGQVTPQPLPYRLLIALMASRLQGFLERSTDSTPRSHR